MYGFCKWSKKAFKKLKKYEDAEEKGLLLKLPCKIGTTVYVLAECKNISQILDDSLESATGYYCPYDLFDKCPHECGECDEAQNKTAVFEDTVNFIGYDETGVAVHAELTNIYGNIGEYIFLNREEAEKALAERVKNGE